MQRRIALRTVLIDGAILTAAGILAGMVAMLATGNVLRSFVFGISPHDPATLVLVALFVGARSLLACYFPARGGHESAGHPARCSRSHDCEFVRRDVHPLPAFNQRTMNRSIESDAVTTPPRARTCACAPRHSRARTATSV